MARPAERPPLRVYHLPPLFRQAFFSCCSGIWLFFTLALLAALYETAVERYAIVPGFTLSSSNFNFSFQFSLDPDQPAQASLQRLDGDGVPASGEIPLVGDGGAVERESLLSGVLSWLGLSKDAVVQSLEDSQAVVSVSETGADGDAGISGTSTESVSHVEVPGEDAVVQSDEGQLRVKDGDDFASEVKDSAGSLQGHPGDGSLDESMDEEVIPEDTGEGHILEGSDDSDYISSVNTDESDGDFDGPKLKLQTVSNATRNSKQEFLEEMTDSVFFTGRLLGGRGLDQGAMPQGGMTVLLMLLILAAALTIFLAVAGFQHAAFLGSVAYSVVSTHMGKRANIRQAIRAGLKSGIERLMWLAILHATVKGLQSLFLMKTLFGSVLDMEHVEQLMLRLSITPFAFLAPFRDVEATDFGMQLRIGLFVVLDYFFDGLAYCVYVVACWVTIMERNFWGLGALSRSWNLVKGMQLEALAVKVLESVICGRSCRWMISQVLGQFPAALAVCIAQVYFLVVWLLFYFSARSIHDGSSQFSYRNLEDFLDRFK
eukprot:c24804_g1_i1 orf=298-1929(-)